LPKSVNTSEYDRFRLALIRARKDARQTQAELARRLRLPQSYVSKYERGERRLDVVELLQVLGALGVDTGEFIRKLGRALAGDDGGDIESPEG
jgi:transcriptional regulator with XRE-family HTH domain